MNFLILPGQLRLSLVLLYGGLAAGLLYDALWFMRKRKWLLPIGDLLFSLCLWGIYTVSLGLMGEEKIRPVTMGIFALGFCLYRLGIHQGARLCFRRISGRKKEAGGEHYTQD